MEYSSKEVFIAKKNERYFLISQFGHIVSNEEYDHITFNKRFDSWIGRIGFQTFTIDYIEGIRTNGFLIFFPKSFEIIYDKVDDKVLYGINIKQKLMGTSINLFPPCFEKAEKIEDFLKVQLNGKFGVLELPGVFTIPNIYDTIHYLGNHCFLVSISRSSSTTIWSIISTSISKSNEVLCELSKFSVPSLCEKKYTSKDNYDLEVYPSSSLGLIEIYYKLNEDEFILLGYMDFLSGRNFYIGGLNFKLPFKDIYNFNSNDKQGSLNYDYYEGPSCPACGGREYMCCNYWIERNS